MVTQCELCRHATQSGAALCPFCREAISRLMMIGEWEANRKQDIKRNKLQAEMLELYLKATSHNAK